MGEEWAASTPFPYFAAPRNDELDEAVRKGRTEEFASFGWDPASIPDPIVEATFHSAALRWTEVTEPMHEEMFAWYRDLLALRRRRPELSDPRPQNTAVDEHDQDASLVIWRGDTAVALNTGDDGMHVALEGHDASHRLLLASDDEVRLTEAGVHLPRHSVAIVGRP